MRGNFHDAVEGASFKMFVDRPVDLERLREDVRERTGLEAHFRFRLGPTRIETNRDGGQRLHCEIEALDDKVLVGTLGTVPLPAEGFYLYVGFFKRMTPA